MNGLRTADRPVAMMTAGEEAEEEDLQLEAMIRGLSLSNLAVAGEEDVSPNRRNAGHDADHGRRPGPRPHLPGGLGTRKTASFSTEGGLAGEAKLYVMRRVGCILGYYLRAVALSLPPPFRNPEIRHCHIVAVCKAMMRQRFYCAHIRNGFLPSFRNCVYKLRFPLIKIIIVYV